MKGWIYERMDERTDGNDNKKIKNEMDEKTKKKKKKK